MREEEKPNANKMHRKRRQSNVMDRSAKNCWIWFVLFRGSDVTATLAEGSVSWKDSIKCDRMKVYTLRLCDSLYVQHNSERFQKEIICILRSRGREVCSCAVSNLHIHHIAANIWSDFFFSMVNKITSDATVASRDAAILSVTEKPQWK